MVRTNPKVQKTKPTPLPPNTNSKNDQMKTILIFRCSSLLNNETREQIRQELKKQIDEGVVITDISLEHVKTMIPKNCECDVVIETLEKESE